MRPGPARCRRHLEEPVLAVQEPIGIQDVALPSAANLVALAQMGLFPQAGLCCPSFKIGIFPSKGQGDVVSLLLRFEVRPLLLNIRLEETFRVVRLANSAGSVGSVK
jgi:hypothetical protein